MRHSLVDMPKRLSNRIRVPQTAGVTHCSAASRVPACRGKRPCAAGASTTGPAAPTTTPEPSAAHRELCGWTGRSTAFWLTQFLPRSAAFRHPITEYARTLPGEYWAEAVTDWVYKDLDRPSEPPPPGKMYRTTGDQRDYIQKVFRGP